MESNRVDGSDCRIYMRPFAAREILEYLDHGDPETHQHQSYQLFYSLDMEDDGQIPVQGSCRQTLSREIGPFDNLWNETTSLFKMLNVKLENPRIPLESAMAVIVRLLMSGRE